MRLEFFDPLNPFSYDQPSRAPSFRIRLLMICPVPISPPWPPVLSCFLNGCPAFLISFLGAPFSSPISLHSVYDSSAPTHNSPGALQESFFSQSASIDRRRSNFFSYFPLILLVFFFLPQAALSGVIHRLARRMGG